MLSYRFYKTLIDLHISDVVTPFGVRDGIYLTNVILLEDNPVIRSQTFCLREPDLKVEVFIITS